MARPKKQQPKLPTPVEAIRHRDTRLNIPTRELTDWIVDEERAPQTLLYPRDPDLDPQLVWKGKDELDATPLEVEAPPLYTQEKIHPQVLIEALRAHSEAPPGLFDDFNGINDFEQKIEFYHHQQHWANRLILGDSLQVMASLVEKEKYQGQVQMVYMDPPYGIKFGSNWQVSTRKREVKDGRAEDLVRQPEQVKAFRDTWEYGVHSYLAYLRDRLVLARDLLTESGSIFVQIGDENVHLVRCVLDEVFGSENFVSLISYQTSVGLGGTYLDNVNNYLLWYGKSVEHGIKYRPLYRQLHVGGQGATRYNSLESPDATHQQPVADDEQTISQLLLQGWRFYTDQGLTSRSGSEGTMFEVGFQGESYRPTAGGWRTGKLGMKRVADANRILKAGRTIRYKKYFDDFGAVALTNQWSDVSGGVSSRVDPKIYIVQTSTKVIERCLLMTTDPGDLVLDPTCGSGTTAYVAEQWGRRWITIDTSRVALALARTRLMSAKFPYYLLADSPEGARKEAELVGQMSALPTNGGDVKRGFVYKRVPHITLKSIANNEEIDAIHTAWQKQLEPLREQLNQRLGEAWQGWEIPHEAEEGWDTEARRLHAQWWKLRGERQKEIDASVARRADTERLVDQPYEDPKRLRVTGPFTVESLSPHRVLTTDDERPASEQMAAREDGDGQYEAIIIENLRRAGVSNTVKGERLHFDALDVYAGRYLHAAGSYTTADGATHRVAVCIGPEHGTVGKELIKEAAKEAVRGEGFDTLVVCGYAFDAHVTEEAKTWGKRLTVLVARMNADLAMGDLLKKTGSGNLFMVFGEPDIALQHTANGELVVSLRGLDIYDPTTGEIRSSSTDDIACWFIDTNYDEESFFARHAYFTGADQPYEKLQRALRAEIDEETWASLYRTESHPFPTPKTGRIAVKVINHYGDEVLKVFDV